MTIRNMLLAGAAVAACLSGPVSAQTGPVAIAGDEGITTDPNADIIVTGSRIPRPDLAGIGPATTISAQQIENTGIVNVETLLQRLPANAGFAGNQTSAYWTSNGYGTAQVNLRGLGIKRTLVLLNGRRLVAGGTGANSAPDLNMIPTASLARVDVLKDGASTIYGADAIAGVVNFVTRSDVDGFIAGARQGITEKGDGSDFSADFLWGKRGDRGGILAAVTYQNTKAIGMASRAPCSLSEVTAGTLSCVNSAATIGGRAALPNGNQINFNQVLGGDGDFYEAYNAAKHNFNSAPYLNAVNPIERVSTALFGDYALGDNITAFGEFLYTHRRSTQIATPGTLRNLAIAASNPTNPTGEDLLLIQRRLAEPGPRTFFQRTDTWQGTIGLRSAFANGWRWEVAGARGRNTGVDGSTNVANLQNVANSLNPALCGTSAIPCADYLGFGDLTQDVLDYILFTSRDRGGNSMTSVTADLGGALFQLPGGEASFAAGVSYHKEHGWRDPDPLTVLGIANTNQQDPISGSSTAKEAFVELSLPLIANKPFFHALTLDGSARLSDYDLFGSKWTYKLGVDWALSRAIRLRGTYGTGFRIPNVPELFGGVSEGNLTTTDPCSNYATSGNATLIANCQASGVPANYVQLGTTILTTTGGNLDLKPETAKNWTIGTVITPHALVPGLTLTADWFDIRINGAIRSIPGSTKLATCYASVNLSHPLCAGFTRSTLTGEVTSLSAQPINTGRETMRGLDLGLAYAGNIGSVAVTVDASVTHLASYSVTPYAGAAPIVFAGYIGGGNGGYPKWRGYTVLSAEKGGTSVSWSTQWIGRARDFNANAGQIGYRMPNVFYHGVQLAQMIDGKTRIQLGADNIFDRKAPYVASYTDANTDTMTYDLMGRRFYVGLRTAF